jgi:hypothetical protein
MKGKAMTRAEFQQYIDCFNRKDLGAVTEYFAADVVVEYYDNATERHPSPRTLHGGQGFLGNYRKLFQSVREILVLRDFLSSEDRVFAELYTEFHPLENAPANALRPEWKAGVPVIMTNWVLYDMEGGKMKRIRIAHFRNHPADAA